MYFRNKKRSVRERAYAWHTEQVTDVNSDEKIGDNFPLFEAPSLAVIGGGGTGSKRVQKDFIRPETRMCVVKSDTNLSSAPIPGTLKEMLLGEYE